MTTKRARLKKPASPRVGDLVRFTFISSEQTGEVIEYRGPLGVNGEHIFGVRYPLIPTYEGEEHYAELPAERLQVIKQAA